MEGGYRIGHSETGTLTSSNRSSVVVVESLFVIDMYQIITIIAGGDGVCVVRV